MLMAYLIMIYLIAYIYIYKYNVTLYLLVTQPGFPPVMRNSIRITLAIAWVDRRNKQVKREYLEGKRVWRKKNVLTQKREKTEI